MCLFFCGEPGIFLIQPIGGVLRLHPGCFSILRDAVGFGLRCGATALSADFAFCRTLPFHCQGFRFLPFYRDGASILCRLHRFARRHCDRLFASVSGLIGFCSSKTLFCFLKRVGGESICSDGLCDLHGIAGLKEFQRYFGVGLKHQRIRQTLVLTALQQFILGFDHLNLAKRIGAGHVFHHNQVAGLGYRKVRFGGDNEAKHLQLRGDVELAFGAIQQHLAEVDRTSFWRDRPHHIGEVFGPEFGCGLQVVEFYFDFDVALLAFDLGFTTGAWQQACAHKIDFCGAASVLVVDGLGGACRDQYTKDRVVARSHASCIFIWSLREQRSAANREECACQSHIDLFHECLEAWGVPCGTFAGRVLI